MEATISGLRFRILASGVDGLYGAGVIVPLKQIEYGVYGDLIILIIICPKPYSILRGTA